MTSSDAETDLKPIIIIIIINYRNSEKCCIICKDQQAKYDGSNVSRLIYCVVVISYAGL